MLNILINFVGILRKFVDFSLKNKADNLNLCKVEVSNKGSQKIIII